MGVRRNAYNILVGKTEGKRPLRIHKVKWEDNIKMDLMGNRVGNCGLNSCLSIGTSGGCL